MWRFHFSPADVLTLSKGNQPLLDSATYIAARTRSSTTAAAAIAAMLSSLVSRRITFENYFCFRRIYADFRQKLPRQITF